MPPVCAGCCAPLPPRKPRSKARKWCSEACRVRSYREPPGKTNCPQCGVETSAYGGRIYCSSRCAWTAQRSRKATPPRAFTCHRCGDPFTREQPKRGARPTLCPSCRGKRRAEIPKAVRIAVYERDEWICQLCMEPVDQTAPAATAWAPTLDHIVCWSAGGGDEPDNLRLAHFWCNSVRADERRYDDDFFRGMAVAS